MSPPLNLQRGFKSMTKPVIVTRAGKGSALTFAEGDANFTNLQDATISVTDGTTTTAIDLNGTITFAAGGDLTVDEATGTITYSYTAPASIENVVEDTTPQLGGDLDVQANKITTTSSVTPLTIEAYQDVGFSFNTETNTTSGVTPEIAINGVLALSDAAGFGLGIITGQSGQGIYIGTNLLDLTNPYINLAPDGTMEIFAQGTDPLIDIAATDGDVLIQGIVYPSTDGTANQFIQTDGEGALSFSSILTSAELKAYKETVYSLSYAATITPDVANGNVQVVTLTGNVTFNAFNSPAAGQSMTLIVKQDATGSRTLTSSMLFAGGDKTLSTAANAVDIISVFYDGTNYWASLGKDFK